MRTQVIATTAAIVMLVGCRVTIPAEEPASDRWATTLGDDTANNVYQCNEHLNGLRTKALVQVYLGNGLAILAGTTTIVSGVLSAAIDENQANVTGAASEPTTTPTALKNVGLSEKEGLALTAAIAAVFTLLGGYVGNPADTLVEHSRRQPHYATIKKLVTVAPPDIAAINDAASSCTSSAK